MCLYYLSTDYNKVCKIYIISAKVRLGYGLQYKNTFSPDNIDIIHNDVPSFFLIGGLDYLANYSLSRITSACYYYYLHIVETR